VDNQSKEFVKEIREQRELNERLSLNFAQSLATKDRDFARERETWNDALIGERRNGNSSKAAQNSIYFKISKEMFEKFVD